MSGYGAVISFLLKEGPEKADRVVAALLHYMPTPLTSAGWKASIERRASVEPPDTQTPQNLLRVSVGLEHVDDLLADMEQGLAI